MKLATACFSLLIMASLLAVTSQYNKNTTSQIRNKMLWMEDEIKSTLEIGCSIRLRNLIAYIQTIWWPHIEYLSSKAPAKEQQHIMKQYNRLQYLLGLKKCESPYETWYQDRCYRTGVPGNPCPKYQQLYNNPDNTGYCYCQRSSDKLNGFIYIDGKCYMLNEQGPCNYGEWLAVKEHNPMCEQAPPGCPIDGQHIYWSCYDGETKCDRRYKSANKIMKCSKLGSVQPSCGVGARLFRVGMKSYCGTIGMVDLTDPNVVLAFPAGNRTCPLKSGQQVREGTILELKKPKTRKETPNNTEPCPSNYYRDVIDGRCKRWY